MIQDITLHLMNWLRPALLCRVCMYPRDNMLDSLSTCPHMGLPNESNI